MMEKILLKSFGGNNKPVNTDDDETAAISAASWLTESCTDHTWILAEPLSDH